MDVWTFDTFLMTLVYVDLVVEMKVLLLTEHLLEFVSLYTILFVSATRAQGCGRTYTELSGLIKSPNYPQPYRNNMNCVYTILLPTGYRITLTFMDFELENGPSCRNDYVEIRDGQLGTAPLIGSRFCGARLPQPQRSTRNEMWILFKTDVSLIKNGFKAIYTASIEPPNFILLTVGNKINLLDTKIASVINVPVNNVQDLAVIDYDYLDGRVIWTSEVTFEIRSAFLNGTDNRRIYNLYSEPRDIAVDSSSRLVFYTDDEYNFIGLFTMSGLYHKIIVNSSLDIPWALSLAPSEGLLFWTDCGTNPKIERANYDGNNRTVVISTSLIQPIALTIDVINGRLYWVDAGTGKVEWSALNGGQRTVIVSSVGIHYFDIGLLNNYLYVTDLGNWTSGGRDTYIRRLDVSSGNITSFYQARELMKHIRVFSDDQNITETNGCSSNNGNCSHICVPLPGNKTSCVCPDGYEWLAEQRTCNQGSNPCSDSNGGCSDRCIAVSSTEVRCTCPKGESLDADNKTCKSECGGNFTSSHGVIQSPSYPRNYQPNLYCIYVITRPPGYYVTLNFSDFQLDNSSNCYKDFVEIRDGRSLTSSLLNKRLCGSALPSLHRTTQNVMLVVFKTDSTNSSKGFRAYFTSGILQHDLMLMAHDTKIIRMDTDTFTRREVQISTLERPVGVDYDPVARRVYWVDQPKSTISSAFLNGTGYTPLANLGVDAAVAGLALDFKAQLLFYADSLNNFIGLITLAHRYQTTVIDAGQEHPMVIALDDSNWLLFWATWSTSPKIERSNYDGSGRVTLVDDYLLEPIALAVDKGNRRVYWVDSARDTLEWINFDGFERTRIQTSVGANMYSVALHREHIFVIEWEITRTTSDRLGNFYSTSTEQSYLHRMNVDGTETQKVAVVSGRLSDIHIFADQPVEEDLSGCRTNNGGCDKICIPLPNNGSRCGCPYGEMLDSTQLRCVNDPIPCANNGNCSHICIPLVNHRRKCQCPNRMSLDRDQMTCLAGCMRNFTVADGVIQSPSFPNDYPNNADCVYIIQVSQDRVIQLTFNNISIGFRYNRNMCYGDYIEIRDGINETAPLIGARLCGSRLPADITSSTNSLWITFRSDSYGSGRGFQAHYTSYVRNTTTTFTSQTSVRFTTPIDTGSSPFFTNESTVTQIAPEKSSEIIIVSTVVVVIIAIIIFIIATVVLCKKGLCFYNRFQHFKDSAHVTFSDLYKRLEGSQQTDGNKTCAQGKINTQCSYESETQPSSTSDLPVSSEDKDKEELQMYF